MHRRGSRQRSKVSAVAAPACLHSAKEGIAPQTWLCLQEVRLVGRVAVAYGSPTLCLHVVADFIRGRSQCTLR